MNNKQDGGSEIAILESVTGNLFGGLQDVRNEVTQAIGGAVTAGETIARACFGVVRIALDRLDTVGAAVIGEGERLCLAAAGLLRRAGREVPGGVADMASAIAGGPAREVIAPRPSA